MPCLCDALLKWCLLLKWDFTVNDLSNKNCFICGMKWDNHLNEIPFLSKCWC